MLRVNIKSFAYSDIEILKDISFNLTTGQHLSVLGESGCGKTTLLDLIYGLLHLENGSILWNEQPLLGPTHNLIPGESFIKLVAQDTQLMPFISVAENIATHLPRANKEIEDGRVIELLEVVGLKDFKNTKVKNLSGGQKQRVALAKALANPPELLLLDEPFSNIDTFRKNTLRRALFLFLKENKISCISATHDSEEAMAFSDNVMILKSGKIDSFGSPKEIYTNLTTEYQAGFFGEVNVVSNKLIEEEKPSANAKNLFLLPHQLKVSNTKTSLQVIVKKSYFRGRNYLIQSELNGNSLFFEHPEEIKKGKLIYLKRS